MIPGIGESFAAIHANVKYQDRAAAFSRQHYRPGLGYVARPARAIDGEAAVSSFFEALGHHGQPA